MSDPSLDAASVCAGQATFLTINLLNYNSGRIYLKIYIMELREIFNCFPLCIKEKKRRKIK